MEFAFAARVHVQALDAPHTCAAAQTGKALLCRYVETFDQQTMLEMTQVVSAEGAALVEAQTSALFGDLKQLQRQMQASFLNYLPRLNCLHLPAVAFSDAGVLMLAAIPPVCTSAGSGNASKSCISRRQRLQVSCVLAAGRINLVHRNCAGGGGDRCHLHGGAHGARAERSQQRCS